MQELLQIEKVLHTEAFTRGSFYAEPKRLHPRFQTCNFTPLFEVRPSFRARRLQLKFQKYNFTQVCDIRPSFRAKGRQGHLQNSHVTIRSGFQHARSRVWHARSPQGIKFAFSHHFTTRLCVLHSRSPQSVTFRWTRLGCPCRLKIQVDHLDLNSCVTTPVEELLRDCVTTPV